MKLILPLPSNHSSHTTATTTLLTLPRHFTRSPSLTPPKFTLFLNPRIHSPFIRRNFSSLCKLNSSSSTTTTTTTELNNSAFNSASITEDAQYDSENQSQFLEIKNPNFTSFISLWRPKFSLSDQAFFLLTFIACTTTAAFVSLVAAAVPTLYAMGRAANSFAKLADTAREELPSTMAAIRLSGMEVSDLTVELSDLSQEISDGVNKSAQAVQAAKVGMRQIGSIAREQTMSMIEERANLPVISLQPAVSGAAKKTSRAVGHATRTLMNLISGGDSISEESE